MRALFRVMAASVCLSVAVEAIPASAQERPSPNRPAAMNSGPGAPANQPATGILQEVSGPVNSPPSPTGAFLRAVVLPGWGHASIGAYVRGGFYFAAETATWYALLRTRARLSEARERAAFREQVLRATLATEGVTDPTEIGERLEADVGLAGVEALVTAREQQQEDWVALSIFLLLLSGADAFVSAHLADFPAPLELEPSVGPGGTVEVSLRLTVPGR